MSNEFKSNASTKDIYYISLYLLIIFIVYSSGVKSIAIFIILIVIIYIRSSGKKINGKIMDLLTNIIITIVSGFFTIRNSIDFEYDIKNAYFTLNIMIIFVLNIIYFFFVLTYDKIKISIYKKT